MKKLINLFVIFVVALLSLTCVFVNHASTIVTADELPNRYYLRETDVIQYKVGYDTLHIDENLDKNKISLIVDGTKQYFNYGFFCHAKGQIIFDIGVDHHFDYFSCYLGVDASRNGNGNVKFSTYTSIDNSSYTEVLTPTVKTSSQESIHLSIPVSNVRYLKFVFDDNGGNAADHSVIASPLLYTEGNLHESDTTIKTLEYYNSLLSNKSYSEFKSTYRLEVLQRSLIEQCGYDNLKELFFCGSNETNRRAMLEWLYNDVENLEEYLMGGNPDGNTSLTAINALCILSNLYQEYGQDLLDSTLIHSPDTTNTNRTYGDVYKTMMFAIALTHANNGPHMWLGNQNISDPVVRYQVFKTLYLDPVNHLRYDVFENLNVEEMRYVVGGRINNDEIYWLNDYVRDKTPSITQTLLDNNPLTQYPNLYSPHRFLKYGKDWDYGGKGYYLEENFDVYDQKYNLTENGLGLTNSPRLWMVFEGSHICWGISYTGSDFANAFGVPAHYVRQEDHAAYFLFNFDENNRTVWSIGNNIYGWTKTYLHEDVVGYGRDRVLCNWGSWGNGWSSSLNATYILLSSTALDHFDEYANAELLLSLEKLAIAQSQQESLYREILEIMPYHLDAWEKLCRYYVQNKTDNEIANLAQELAQQMYYFPLPMHDLLNILKGGVTNQTQLAKINNVELIYLQKGTNATNDTSALSLLAQPSICTQEANYLLGNLSSQLATFSFDGTNKNQLVFGNEYSNVVFCYSIDGGITWSDYHALENQVFSYTFTDLEISNLSDTTDILIWLQGWASSDGNPSTSDAFKIDILPGTVVTNIESNDHENCFFGDCSNVEYSIDNGNTWLDLTSSTVFEGQKTVLIRKKANGTTLIGIQSTYEFTDNDTSIRKYVTKDRLSVVGYSSEEASQRDYAVHVIDGLTSTRWHTTWKSNSDLERYITIKVDSPIILTGLDYLPVGNNSNGTASAFDIYVSTNGVDYYKAAFYSNLGTNGNRKSVQIEPIYCQYIKFVGTNTVGGFCSAKLIELFEDVETKNYNPSTIELSKTPTNNYYFLNQRINKDDFTVSLVYENQTKVRVPNVDLEYSMLDTSEPGNYTLNISYLEYESLSFPYEVKDLDECEAIIGNIAYETLKQALLEAVEGDVILLVKNITVTENYSISKKITIDGNGYTLFRGSTYTNGRLLSIGNTGELILSNIILDGGADWHGEENVLLKRGCVGNSVSSPLIDLSGNGKIVLNNTILKNNYNTNAPSGSDPNTGGAIFAKDTARIVFNSGKILDCYTQSFGSAMYLRGSSSLIINDCYVKGNSGSTQYNTTVFCIDNDSTCEVNGGEFVNNVGVNQGCIFWMSKGSLTINGGLFKDNTANIGTTIYVKNSGAVIIQDFVEIQEIYLSSGKYITIASTLEGKTIPINSETKTVGTIIAKYSQDIDSNTLLLSLTYPNMMLTSSDGNVTLQDVSSAQVKHIRGTQETYFDSFESAILVCEHNDQLKLLKDINLETNTIVSKKITIDCDVYSFTGLGDLIPVLGHEKTFVDNLISFSDHVYSTITYIWSEDLSICVARATCECGYYEEETCFTTSVISQNRSCELDELTKYIATFLNELFQTQLKENVVTKAKEGHQFLDVSYKEPTKNEDGNIAYQYCKTCHKKYLNGTEITDVIIPKIEQNNLWIWIVISIGSLFLFGILFFFIYYKKKNKKQ